MEFINFAAKIGSFCGISKFSALFLLMVVLQTQNRIKSIQNRTISLCHADLADIRRIFLPDRCFYLVDELLKASFRTPQTNINLSSLARE